MRHLQIIRIQGDSTEVSEDRITEEISLRLLAEHQRIAELMCSPGDLEDLIRGFFFTNGFISRADQIRRVVVNVLPDQESGGRIMVGGRRIQSWELDGLIGYGSKAGRQMEVRIRADRTVPYRVVEPLMIACARAGVWKVTFAVVGKSEG